MNTHQNIVDVDRSMVPITPEVDFVRVRFAGDSGDGIQLTGTRFAEANADFGNDFATFPDYPAEIRAPVGTTYGVSAYSINIGCKEIQTYGDQPDMLVALNPAALKVNISELRSGGLLLIDTGAFTPRNLAKAGFESDPRHDDSLRDFRVMEVDISGLTLASVKDIDVNKKNGLRCKNMWTLGLVLWMFGRSREPVVRWLTSKFAKQPEIRDANIAALNSGHAYGETMELGDEIPRYDIPPAQIAPGTYKSVTGAHTLAMGLKAAAKLSGLGMVFASYPITPASPILHDLANSGDADVTVFQAEDEISAICAAIGASFAGKLGVTSSSGPGLSLKTEAMGLAISTELPLIVIDVQRGGPSTGLPTKTEQSDLLQAVFGRNGDTPVPVIAVSRPSDCFDCAIEAARIAVRSMTPVILLSDGYVANMTEPWRLPDRDSHLFDPFMPDLDIESENFSPFTRDRETLGRNWPIPGTPGLEHRIGGLEKDYDSGDVSYDGENHQRMTDMRVEKIRRVARTIPDQQVDLGRSSGKLAIVGWGGTYGSIHIAVMRARLRGYDVSHIHLRHLWPLPSNLGELFAGFDQILVPELNTGQLVTLLRSQHNRSFEQLNKVTGKPFKVTEINDSIEHLLEAD
jgi:2-oxoglutarate ferredoxin oxidoreductase subunit alpha